MVTLKERGEQMRTPESIEKIKKLISEGSNIRQISTEMKCSSNLVSTLLKENNLKPPFTAIREKLRQPENIEIIRNLIEAGTPIKHIALKYECTPHTIYTLINEEQLTDKNIRAGAPRKSRIHLPENMEKIKQMREDGCSIDKISKDMDTSWKTVASLIKANNWTKQL